MGEAGGPSRVPHYAPDDPAKGNVVGKPRLATSALDFLRGHLFCFPVMLKHKTMTSKHPEQSV